LTYFHDHCANCPSQRFALDFEAVNKYVIGLLEQLLPASYHSKLSARHIERIPYRASTTAVPNWVLNVFKRFGGHPVERIKKLKLNDGFSKYMGFEILFLL
jgi:hypothetical protein